MPAARMASTRARSSSATTAATCPSYDVKSRIRSLCARQCMATYLTSGAASATTSRIVGSARPPDTSLTTRAPAASAAVATSARMVSTETDRAVGGERLDDGYDATQLLLDERSGRARPGRLAADVEDVGTVREQLPPVRDRALGVEEQPAVGERVGRDVDDPHHLRRLRHARQAIPPPRRSVGVVVPRPAGRSLTRACPGWFICSNLNINQSRSVWIGSGVHMRRLLGVITLKNDD